MDNLANTYVAEGKLADGEALHSQTAEIQRRVLGPEHPQTLLTTDNLAWDYTSEGKFAQAEPLFKQVLEIRRRVLNPEHPQTLHTLFNLQLTYQQQGEYVKAESTAAQALAIERRLANDEDSIAEAAAHLALAYISQGKFAEGEPLARLSSPGKRRAPTVG